MRRMRERSCYRDEGRVATDPWVSWPGHSSPPPPPLAGCLANNSTGGRVTGAGVGNVVL